MGRQEEEEEAWRWAMTEGEWGVEDREAFMGGPCTIGCGWLLQGRK